MGKPLDPKRRELIASLLRDGRMTKAAIRREIGVSSSTIAAIERELSEPPAEIGVCPTCRHRVALPCLACSLIAAGERIYGDDGGALRLGLELEPEEWQRYIEVRRMQGRPLHDEVPV